MSTTDRRPLSGFPLDVAVYLVALFSLIVSVAIYKLNFPWGFMIVGPVGIVYVVHAVLMFRRGAWVPACISMLIGLALLALALLLAFVLLHPHAP